MAAEKKYEFTGRVVRIGPPAEFLHHEVSLRCIRALRDFGDVKKGDLGGYIEHEGNLSHEGDCWVGSGDHDFLANGCVFGNAKISGDALVADGARVFGHAQVYGFAEVSGGMYIYDRAKIHGNAKIYGGKIYGCAEVFENAKVRGRAEIYGNSHVYGHAQVSDKAEVYGNARVYGEAQVYKEARVYGQAKVFENAHVCGQSKVYDNALVHGHANIRGNAHVRGNADVCDYEDYRDDDEVYMCNRVSQSTNEANEAHKNDDGKARVDLIPPLSLIEIGRVLEFGAKKYGANNWRNGMHWSRFHGAALRHLLAWFGGENKDGESDLSHLAHAACCLLFLMECEAKQIGHDDRFKSKEWRSE